MENKNQTQFNIDEEAINAFVEKHVRKSQREETAAILRWMNGKNISDIFDEQGAQRSLLDSHSRQLKDLYFKQQYNYQKMGLVNKYVAATAPRHIPTFFCVAPSK